jgi:hypothetical protein
MQYTAKSPRRKPSRQAKTTRDAVWECTIVRDVSSLVRAAMAGNRFALKFVDKLGDWVKIWACVAPAKAPLCLACAHEFNRQVPGPTVFSFIHSDDPRARYAVVTGVCDRCAGKSDDELMMIAGKWISATTDGRVIGFSHIPPSQGH